MMSIFNRLALSTMKVTIMSTNGRLSTNEPEDRRRVRTRQMLRNALLELIDEKGYESVTVQEITDRADLSRATFYLHFKDKDELLVATLQAMYDDIRDALTVKEGATMQPNHVALNAFKHVQAHRKLYKVLLGERGMAAVWQRIQAYMFTYAHQTIRTVRRHTGYSETRVPTEILAQFSAGALNALLIWWVQHDFAYSAEEMASMYQKMIQPMLMANMVNPNTKPPTE